MTMVAPTSAVVLAQAVVTRSCMCCAVPVMRLPACCPTNLLHLLLLLLLALG